MQVGSREGAGCDPDRIAVVVDGGAAGDGDLGRPADGAARRFRARGLRAGDHAVLAVGNGPGIFAFVRGDCRAGHPPATLGRVKRPGELRVVDELRAVDDLPRGPAGQLVRRELAAATREAGVHAG